MKKQSKKIKALRELRRDAPPLCVRRAVKELMGVELNDMAKELGYTRQVLGHYIQGRRGKRRKEVQAAVARFWRLPVEELWPDEETE